MTYDFQSIIDRTGKDALAFDSVDGTILGGPTRPKEGFDLIPMWVADMNFATCPAITQAMQERIRHPLFGYYQETDAYFDAIVKWQSERNGYTGLCAEQIGYENGVHGFLTSCVNVLSQPGEAILVHRPTYVGFSSDIQQQGRRAVYSDLVKDENGIYRMDFEDMETKIRENHIHLIMFCSPHNPTGRVWERWELEKALEIFEKYDCYVISDEIWSDLVYPGHQHIPTQMVSSWAREHAAAAYSPSKTFSLAGLVGSYHIIYNRRLRDQISRYGHYTCYNSQNVLSMHALLGAYSDEGREWTQQLLSVLEENCRYLHDYLSHVPGIRLAMPQGTYMLFPDIKEYCLRTGRTQKNILQAGWDAGIGWQDGAAFGGPTHIRINAASPLSRIREACRRMEKYVFTDNPQPIRIC